MIWFLGGHSAGENESPVEECAECLFVEGVESGGTNELSPHVLGKGGRIILNELNRTGEYKDRHLFGRRGWLWSLNLQEPGAVLWNRALGVLPLRQSQCALGPQRSRPTGNGPVFHFFFIPKTTLLGIVWKIMFSSLPIQSYQARYGLLPVSPQRSLGRPSQCSSGPRGGGQFREGGRKLSLPASLSLGGRPSASFTPISCGCRQLWRKAEKKVQVWVRDRYSEIRVPLPPCNNWPAACSCPLTKVSLV